jgi:hypothetical protein
MGVYEIKTDQGTFEVTTEEPEQAHPQIPDIGKSLDLTPAAEAATQAVNPPVDIPQDTSPQGYFSRILGATKDALLTPIAPFVPSLRNRLFSPQVGQAGPSQILEQEGRRVGQAVRASDASGKLAASPLGGSIPAPAYFPMAMGAEALNAASDSLTPTAQAQNVGAEGLGKVLGLGADKLAEALDRGSVGPARRATGFMKPDLRSTKSPFESIRKTAQANMAGKEMLDRGAIPLLGSPGEMQDNALNILAEGRGKVAQVIDAVDSSGAGMPTTDLGKSISSSINPKFKDEISAVNAVVDDMEAINPESLSIKDLEELKVRWGKLGFQDKTVGSTVADVYRKAYKAADKAIKAHIESVAPDMLGDYVAGKKSMEVANTALRGITNKGAREAANNPLSLPSIIMGAGDVAQGNLPQAAAKIGVTQAVTNRGAALTANLMKGGSDVLKAPGTPALFSQIIQAARSRIAPQNNAPAPVAPTSTPRLPAFLSKLAAPGASVPTSEAAQNSPGLKSLTPEMLALRNGVGAVLDEDYSKAVKYLKKVLSINPKNLEARRTLERIALKQGKDIDAYKSK